MRVSRGRALHSWLRDVADLRPAALAPTTTNINADNDQYLRIQRLRFGGCTYDALVATLLLQTLVENAVRLAALYGDDAHVAVPPRTCTRGFSAVIPTPAADAA